MDPQTAVCPNEGCRDKGRRGAGNSRVHSRTEQRSRCTTCGRTFDATRGTPSFRMRTAVEVVTLAVTLLCHGCPLQAIVAAFGLDARTVTTWWERTGQPCERVHAHLVRTGRVDELWVTLAGQRVWHAMALAA